MIIPHSKPTIDEKDIEAINKVVESRMHADGKTVEKFEKTFKEKVGARYAIATSSGSSALFIILQQYTPTTILAPSFTCIEVLSAVRLAGHKWRIGDISPLSYNLSQKDIENFHNGFVVFPYMFGNPIGTSTNVIEDFAQALGSAKPRNTAMFSFYANKMISTGHGGMITTNDKDEYLRLKDYLNSDERDNAKPSFNFKMPDINAALGISQLKKLDRFIKIRREIAKEYSEAFNENQFYLNPNHIFYRYVIPVSNPDLFIKRCRKQGVDCRRPVYKPLHHYVGCICPNTDKAYNELVSIPIYPSLSEEQISKVINVVQKETHR